MIELTPDGILVSNKGLFCEGYTWPDILKIIEEDLRPVCNRSNKIIYFTDTRKTPYNIPVKDIFEYMRRNEIELLESLKAFNKSIGPFLPSFVTAVSDIAIKASHSPNSNSSSKIIRVLGEEEYAHILNEYPYLRRGVSSATPAGKRLITTLGLNQEFSDERLIITKVVYDYMVNPKFIPLKSFVLEVKNSSSSYKPIRWDTWLNKNEPDVYMSRWLRLNIKECVMTESRKQRIKEELVPSLKP